MRPMIAILLLSLLAYHTLAESENAVDDTEEVKGGYDSEDYIPDPCNHHHCGPGHECKLDDEDQPTCVCRKACPEINEERLKVCSTQNVTFASECELHRQKCLCHRKDQECEDRQYRHAHIDYYGQCRELKECLADEMEEYPKRLREWLFLIMQELADRHDLPRNSEILAREAKQSSKRWVLPAIWKFCDLDISHNRLVSPQELVPLSAPLKAMEHCTSPFLQKCDEDADGEISLTEWGVCIGMDPEEIQDRCEEFMS